MRRHDFQYIDILAGEVIGEHRLALRPPLRNDMEAPTRDQCRKNHGVAEVCGDRRDSRVTHSRFELQTFRNVQHITDDVAMLDTDALWSARGTTRINIIREIAGLRRNIV